MWVTVYTDASFHPERGAAWAAWLRSNAGRLVVSGRCPPDVTDNNLAEFHAVVEGIKCGLERWRNVGITGFLVKTDSRNAVALFKYRAPAPKRPRHANYQAELQTLLGPSLRLRIEWVPGHQRTRDAAAWLNNAVDKLSRQTLR